MIIPMMATALIAARISGVFTPPLYEALAQSNYFPQPPAAAPALAAPDTSPADP
jgi:hypothetical protein